MNGIDYHEDQGGSHLSFAPSTNDGTLSATAATSNILQLPNWLLTALASSTPVLDSPVITNNNDGNMQINDVDDDYCADDVNKMPLPRPIVLVSPFQRKQTTHRNDDAAAATIMGEETHDTDMSSVRRTLPFRLYDHNDDPNTIVAWGNNQNVHFPHPRHAHEDPLPHLEPREDRGVKKLTKKQAPIIGTIPTDIDKIKVFVKPKTRPHPRDPKVQKVMDFKANKNFLSRERNKKKREALAAIHNKNFEDMTTNEQDIYKMDMECRHKKQILAKARELQKKEEVTRITNITEHDRTSLERTFMKTALAARRKKIMGDRLRRKRNAEQGVLEREQADKNRLIRVPYFPLYLDPRSCPPTNKEAPTPAAAAATSEDHKQGPHVSSAVPPVLAPYFVPSPTTVMLVPPSLAPPVPIVTPPSPATVPAITILVPAKKKASSRVPSIYSGPPGGMMMLKTVQDNPLPRPSLLHRGRAVNDNKSKAVKKKPTGKTKKLENGGGMFLSSTNSAIKTTADTPQQKKEGVSSPTFVGPQPLHSNYCPYPAFFVVCYPPVIMPHAGQQFFYPMPHAPPPVYGSPSLCIHHTGIVTNTTTKTMPTAKKSLALNGSEIMAGKHESSGVATSSSRKLHHHGDGTAAVMHQQAQVIPPSPSEGHPATFLEGVDHENFVLHQDPDGASLLVGFHSQSSDADMRVWPSHHHDNDNDNDEDRATFSAFASAPTPLHNVPTSPASTKQALHALEPAASHNNALVDSAFEENCTSTTSSATSTPKPNSYNKNDLVAHGSAFDECSTTKSATPSIGLRNDAILDHSFLFLNADGRSMSTNVSDIPRDAFCSMADNGDDSSMEDEWLDRI